MEYLENMEVRFTDNEEAETVNKDCIALVKHGYISESFKAYFNRWAKANNLSEDQAIKCMTTAYPLKMFVSLLAYVD